MTGKQKRVAVLGGNGFVGRRVTDVLLQRGHEVHIYSRHAMDVNRDHPNLCRFNLDIRLARQLPGADEYDAVVNATGRVAGVGYNSTHQSEMLVENFELMRHAADLAAAQARYFVQLSSACVYANEVSAGAREEQGMVGDPDAANYGYGWGKRMGEIYTQTRFDEIQKPVVILRPYNLYGPGDDFSEHAHVIPSLIRKFIFEPEVRVWGDGSQIREFVFVDDLAKSIVEAIERRLTGVFNVCGGRKFAVTIADLVEAIEAILQTGKPVVYQKSGPSGQPVRFGNPEKAQSVQIQSVTPLTQGLRRTIGWYLSQIQRDETLPETLNVKWREFSHALDPIGRW